MISITFIIPIILICFAIYKWISQYYYEYSYRFFLPYGLLFFYILVMYPWSVYRNAKSNYESNAALNEKLQFTISETHLQIIGESFELKTEWKNIPQIQRYQHALLFYASKTTAYFVDLNQVDALDKVYLIETLKTICRHSSIKTNIQ
ncbi:MAG: hypothetical protein WCP57_00520 [Bacteroidota bacterium]